MANEIVFKITTDSQGNPVHINSMPIEAANAFIVFLETLSKIAEPHKDKGDIRISIREGSAEGVLAYPESASAIKRDFIDVIEGRSTNSERVKILKKAQDTIKANGLGYKVFYTEDDIISDLTAEFKSKGFAKKRGRRLEWNECVEFVKGKLFEAGGKVKTNVHLDVDGKDIKVECSIQQATRLNKLLYSDIRLCILKKWKDEELPSYSLMDSYVTDSTYLLFKDFYQEFQKNKSLDRFDVIYEKVIQAVEKPKVKMEIIKLMRLFDHPQADRGVLRTMLIALKPVRDREPIAFMYDGLAEVLREGSTHKVI